MLAEAMALRRDNRAAIDDCRQGADVAHRPNSGEFRGHNSGDTIPN
jgi:hypothetical protein